jgi:hypothetical protein
MPRAHAFQLVLALLPALIALVGFAVAVAAQLEAVRAGKTRPERRVGLTA